MTRLNPDLFFDDEYDGRTGETRRRKPRQTVRGQHAEADELLQHANLPAEVADTFFNPTFSGSHHERSWILNSLGRFYDEKVITDVLHKVKGGKEANVYCCAPYPGLGVDLVAAKIYRPRMFRNLRNDSRYRQGRYYVDAEGKQVNDIHMLKAIYKRSNFGKKVAQSSWMNHEHLALNMLYDAGADVPKPLAAGENVILMEYIGEEGMPAPTLGQVKLTQREAHTFFDRMVHNLEVMLNCQRIHGDLSAYNVLYWEGAFKIIDFPQVVIPGLNRESFAIFQRDVLRICQYFERYGLGNRPEDLADSLWNRYAHAEGLDIDWLDEADD